MLTIVEKNLGFFIPVFMFFACGMLLDDLMSKGDYIVFFSERRTPFWNVFFTYGTKLGEEYAYLVLFVLLLFKKVRFAIMIPLIGITVSFCSYGLKDVFSNLRPMDYFLEIGNWSNIVTVEGVELLRGASSFPSGHTMSAFALYTFLALIFEKNTFTDILLFFLAVMIGISRIYLVQHFLIDVLAGAYCGILIGILMHSLQKLLSTINIGFLERKVNIFP